MYFVLLYCYILWLIKTVFVEAYVLLKIFEIKAVKKEAIAKLHDEDLHDLCLLPHIITLNNQEGRDGRDMWHLWGCGNSSRI
jgi:hypothetical protein